jgi:hypothetical protein
MNLPIRRCLPLLWLLACLACAGPREGNRSDALAPRALSFVHPVAEPSAQLRELCAAIPCESKDRVYVFVINGADPLYLGNLNGLCARMCDLGFRNVDCAEMWQGAAVRDRIVELCRRDKDARIALVGYSIATKSARSIANELKEQNVKIDLLVYLGGDTIGNTPASRPENVAKVLNINGHGYLPRGGDLFFNGTDIDSAENQRLDARHILLPSRPETVELLGRHLVTLAQRLD